MIIYGLGRSRSFRTLWAIEECGFNHEYINVNFEPDHPNSVFSGQYQALNTQGKVPTLVDGDLVMTESAAQLNYLARKAEQFIPTDAATLAKYDELCFFVMTELEQPLWTNGKHRFALPQKWRVPEVIETSKKEWDKAVNALRKLVQLDNYALGSKFTMADILVAHTLAWAESFGYPVESDLQNYRDRMFQRDACQRALETVKPYLKK